MEPRFLVDINVGRLAKWLRILGYDTILVRDVEDHRLLERAQQEGRIVVSKDRHLLWYRSVTTGQVAFVLITSDHVGEQLAQVVAQLALEPSKGLSRCVQCNTRLQPMEKEQVRDRVSPFVYRAHQHFLGCSTCGRIYWPGTHWRRMRRELSRLSVPLGNRGPEPVIEAPYFSERTGA